MRYAAILLIFLAQAACSQDKNSTLKQNAAKDFVGIWEAFQEGATPNETLGEEPSKLIILMNRDGNIIVTFAVRNADRQIRFHFGKGQISDGVLRFTDQNGFAYRIDFGEDKKRGHVLCVAPDYKNTDADYGSYYRVEMK